MATVLSNYQSLRGQVEERMRTVDITSEMLWWYGEPIYRIGVLETLQAYNNAAPPVMDLAPLQGHYWSEVSRVIRSVLPASRSGTPLCR